MSINNFSWIIPQKLAGSAMPTGFQYGDSKEAASDLKELAGLGIRCLVSLVRIPPSLLRLVKPLGIEWLSYPIDDFDVPRQMPEFNRFVDSIIERLEEEKPVCVHCYAGVGRTGLVLSCVLGKYRSLEPSEAIREIRRNRDSLETAEQERFIFDFFKRCLE